MDQQDVTRTEPIPPHEATSSPVDVSVAMPRYFGVTPPTLLFGVACATLAIAIVLAVLGHWVAALVLAAVVLGEVAMFLSVARRKPDTGVARASSTAVRRVSDRARWIVEATSVRTEAGRGMTALRRELLELSDRRERALRDFGAAVYDGDEEGAERLEQELRAIDEEGKEKERQLRAIAEAAEERLRAGRQSVQPTVIQPPGDEE
jgi:hypothetical protein